MMFLEGIRILDLSRVLAGPIATQNLADMGAEVLKIESPSGDDTRHWGPPFVGDMAAYFMSCNRNKSSLVLDLKSDEGQARLRALVKVADVVVDNFPPKARHRLRVDAETLRGIKPELVTASITGYRGTRIDEPGYDVMIQAESGLMGITGPADGVAHKTGVAIVDVLTGMMTSNGILAALLRRFREGTGASIDISLYQTALLSLVNVATNYLVSGKRSTRWGNAHANIVPYQDFETADGTVIVGAGNQRQFLRLCDLLGIEDEGMRDTDNAGRVSNRERVLETLGAVIKKMASDVLLKDLKDAGIPCAPILNPAEAIQAVQKWDDQAVLALRHETLGMIGSMNNPIVGDGMREVHTAPPSLNQDGEVLAQRWLEP